MTHHYGHRELRVALEQRLDREQCSARVGRVEDRLDE